MTPLVSLVTQRDRIERSNLFTYREKINAVYHNVFVLFYLNISAQSFLKQNIFKMSLRNILLAWMERTIVF